MRVKATGRADAKLLGVLARLCERRGKLTATRAAKLPYLVDLIALRVLGRRITKAQHETWEHGVVTREAWTIVKHERDCGLFKFGTHFFGAGGSTIQL